MTLLKSRLLQKGGWGGELSIITNLYNRVDYVHIVYIECFVRTHKRKSRTRQTCTSHGRLIPQTYYLLAKNVRHNVAHNAETKLN